MTSEPGRGPRPLLWRRRTLIVPTLLGWVCLLILACAPIGLWWFYGERFLATTHRVDADVLVIESWTEEAGADAAIAEFTAPGRHYRYIVAAGGLNGHSWDRRRWDTTEIVAQEFRRRGFRVDTLIRAHADDVESHRTYAAARAAWTVLDGLHIHARGINVITRGPHARRSWLTFRKVFDPVPVGIISWKPSEYAGMAWWTSSERALDLLKETVGYPYELLFSSGR